MSLDHHPTAQKLLQSLMQFRKASWQLRSIEGCKPSEIRVLFCIHKNVSPENPVMKVSDISKRLQVTSPTITQLIKSLEADGLVERNIDPVDRRAVGIKLTEFGEAVTKKAKDALHTRMNGLIEYLGEEDSNRLSELLQKASGYFQQREAGIDHVRIQGGEEDV
ncbi:UNVERIFIED_CONTAM: DNA-binding MarR family transcriptional regulator [Brevibacillus sp. OAP136]